MPFVPRRVFVVEDDEAASLALARLIRSFGWSAQAFGSAYSCFYAATVDRPDCIVSGLDMPGMDGAQLAAALATKGVTVPVIIVAGRLDDAAKVDRARAAGAAKILHKPCWDEELRRTIQEVTRSNSGVRTW
jgi:FixJ family two-component response regulator